MAGMRLLAFAAAVAAKAFATELRDPIQDDFDCKMRTLALDYAEYIQPWRSADVFQGIADALNGTPEKAADCTVAYEGSRPTIASGSASRFRQPPLVAPRNGGITVYVSPTGSDSNNGTIDAPMKTLPAALAATRANEGWDTIVMRQGTYYASVAAGVPNPTLALGPADSGLTVQAFPGEDVWLSGGVPLVGITWNVSNITTTQWVMVNNSVGNQPTCCLYAVCGWVGATAPTAPVLETMKVVRAAGAMHPPFGSNNLHGQVTAIIDSWPERYTPCLPVLHPLSTTLLVSMYMRSVVFVRCLPHSVRLAVHFSSSHLILIHI